LDSHHQPYNYARFKPKFYDLEHFPGPKPGEKFPSIQLNDGKGNEIPIDHYKGEWVVIETGSVTCPQYVANINFMKDLQEKYPKVEFLLLYIREAHPGNKIPSHKTFEEKCMRANLSKKYDEFRPAFIDDLDGHTHKKLGMLPNCIYILNPEQVVVFRSDWNVPMEIDRVLKKSDPEAIFLDDHFEPKPAPPLLATKVLLNAGWESFLDLILGLPKLINMHFKTKNIKRFH
jgi:Iodothyronine deiodinase